jgi:hypothetical protein
VKGRFEWNEDWEREWREKYEIRKIGGCKRLFDSRKEKKKNERDRMERKRRRI